ncbi:uncharacterized protein LOC119268478 [Triticum dicoccoides]|uniref:uncharacterized protein LOC119268478 n=1 Tax=Triticum dicoccoides TaxID=85692 RepID=UPI00188E5599|nr:uncharacterized protein LOC119268478 [Triticum dicoccoides]
MDASRDTRLPAHCMSNLCLSRERDAIATPMPRWSFDSVRGGGPGIHGDASSASERRPCREFIKRLPRSFILCKRYPSASTRQGPTESLGGLLRMMRSIGCRKRMDGKSGGGSWRQAPAPVRQLFRRVRRAMLRPKHRAVSFEYDLKSYFQNFDDGLVPAHRL